MPAEVAADGADGESFAATDALLFALARLLGLVPFNLDRTFPTSDGVTPNCDKAATISLGAASG